MSIKSLLMLHAAAMAYMDCPEYFDTAELQSNVDFSLNIKPYHSKPIRKGAGKKKLSKKQRKSQNLCK